MKLADIPYFVKFTFVCEENGNCISTTDSEMLKFVIHPKSKNPVNRLEVGYKILFEPVEENPIEYEITEIIIKHIVDDTDYHQYGIDMEDCVSDQGEQKEWLFGILIKMKVT